MERVSGAGVGCEASALPGPGGDGQLLSFPILPSRGPSKDKRSMQATMRYGRIIKSLLF